MTPLTAAAMREIKTYTSIILFDHGDGDDDEDAICDDGNDECV